MAVQERVWSNHSHFSPLSYEYDATDLGNAPWRDSTRYSGVANGVYIRDGEAGRGNLVCLETRRVSPQFEDSMPWPPLLTERGPHPMWVAMQGPPRMPPSFGGPRMALVAGGEGDHQEVVRPALYAPPEGEGFLDTGEEMRSHHRQDGLFPRLQHTLLESLAFAREKIDDAKEKVLDYIYNPERDGYDTRLPMPPCPPCDVYCGCGTPTRIEHVPDIVCDSCGATGCACCGCGCYVATCPACGRPFRPRCACMPSKICPASLCQSVCAPRPPVPQPLPELVVTSVGPFMEKGTPLPKKPCCGSRCTASQALSQWICDTAHDCSYTVGSKFAKCCSKEVPPAPLPGRPIQKLAPMFFPPAPPPERPSLLPFCPFKKRPRPRQPPRGGWVGAIEDLATIGFGAATALGETLVEAAESLSSGYAERPENPLCYCSCAPPFHRYPKNGVYEDPPDPPTRTTGCRAIDALNNFLDATTTPAADPESLRPVTEVETPETEKTGNPIIDYINGALDKLFPPEEASEKKLRVRKQDPVIALITYLTEKPRPLPKEPTLTQCVLPCYAREGNGLPWVDNHLPPCCFGEELDGSCPLKDKGHIDYVDFSLMPSDVGILPGPHPA